MKIKFILINNFGHLGREYQHLKKTSNYHTPKVQGKDPFTMQPLLWQFKISMVYWNA